MFKRIEARLPRSRNVGHVGCSLLPADGPDRLGLASEQVLKVSKFMFPGICMITTRVKPVTKA